MDSHPQLLERGTSRSLLETTQPMRDRIGAKSYKAGSTIFGPLEGQNRIYIVRQGWVRVYKTLPDGRAITFALLGPNSIVSQESPDMSGSTAEAFVDCVVAEADIAAVVDLVARAPQLASAIICGLQRRVTQLHGLIEQLLVRDTSMRLAATLLMLVDAFGEPMLDSEYSRITTTITHQFLANMIGSNRVTVTRKLLDLQSENHLKSLGRNSIAVNVTSLRNYLKEKEAKLETKELLTDHA
jgi:CRP/FNR family transcriptional regulator